MEYSKRNKRERKKKNWNRFPKGKEKKYCGGHFVGLRILTQKGVKETKTMGGKTKRRRRRKKIRIWAH